MSLVYRRRWYTTGWGKWNENAFIILYRILLYKEAFPIWATEDVVSGNVPIVISIWAQEIYSILISHSFKKAIMVVYRYLLYNIPNIR